MRKKKHDYTYTQYRELVSRIEALKSPGRTVDEACKEAGVQKKFYNYAKQVVRRGKPMSEIEFEGYAASGPGEHQARLASKLRKEADNYPLMY